MKRPIVFIWLIYALTGVFSPASAQYGMDETQEWLGLNLKKGFGSTVILRSDVQLRWTDAFKKWRTMAVRSGINYYFAANKSGFIGVGPAIFLSPRSGSSGWNNEYRLWEEAGKEIKFNRMTLTFKYRQEQRWMCGNDDRCTYFNRFRFRNELHYTIPTPWNPDARAGFYIWNEWFIHQQKKLGFFNDQYRLYSGFQWYFNGSFSVNAHYIWFPFVRNGDGTYSGRQAIRLNLNFDFL